MGGMAWVVCGAAFLVAGCLSIPLVRWAERTRTTELATVNS